MKLELENAIYEKDDEVAIIKLNRPKVNAAIPALYRDLITAFEEAKKDLDVRAIVLEGEGRCFSAGADIKVVSHEPVDNTYMQQLARSMRAADKPIIAACHGWSLGGGLEVALNADIIIAAEGAQFGFPEASVGAMVTKGSTKILPLLVGVQKAKELFFTSEFIDAKEAERIGLVSRVVPLDEMHKAAMELARKITKNYPQSVKIMRQCVDRGVESSFETILDLESYVALTTQQTLEEGMTKRAEEISKKKG